MAGFETLHPPILISRKIWVTETFFNFHTMEMNKIQNHQCWKPALYFYSYSLQTWAVKLGIHNVEISGFFYWLDFTWNQFWSFWSPITTILAVWAALKLEFLVTFGLLKCKNVLQIKIQRLQNCYNNIFWPSEMGQNWFHIKSEW